MKIHFCESVDYQWGTCRVGDRAPEIGFDDPVPLHHAAKLFFPAGGIKPHSLRTEIRKGNLVTERIAGKDFVTKRAIEEMREKCRTQLRGRGFTSASVAAESRYGSSGMVERRSQRAATKATANKLKRRLPTTLRENTERPQARVIPIR